MEFIDVNVLNKIILNNLGRLPTIFIDILDNNIAISIAYESIVLDFIMDIRYFNGLYDIEFDQYDEHGRSHGRLRHYYADSIIKVYQIIDYITSHLKPRSLF